MDTHALKNVIVKQALELAELKEKVDNDRDRLVNIQRLLYCIGGPLNDNKLNYTVEQAVIFSNIDGYLLGVVSS